jgi:hypothetical protein
MRGYVRQSRNAHGRKGGGREDENLLDLHSTASNIYRENQISLG